MYDNKILLLIVFIILYKIYITYRKIYKQYIEIEYKNINFFILNKNQSILHDTGIENFYTPAKTDDVYSTNRDKIILFYNIIKNLYILRCYLYSNINKYDTYRQYILLLFKNFNKDRTVFSESDINTSLTSFTVNKGEKISLCLIDKGTFKLHDYNLIMYVAIHELAHVACPEVGHGDLFADIFKFLLEIAININIYKYDNMRQNPRYYCGILLDSYILD